MIKALIVDDVPQDSLDLSHLIKKSRYVIDIVSIVSSIDQAVEEIRRHSPDLIFLDILLTGESGFELLERFSFIEFDIIFTTRFIDNHILQIRQCGLSYLAKPIDIGELEDAIGKYILMRDRNTGTKKIDNLKHNLQINDFQEHRICLIDQTEITVVTASSILYVESQNQYSTFYLTGEQKIISSRSIKHWEELLTASSFYRVHQSFLINLIHVFKFIKSSRELQLHNTNHRIVVAGKRVDGLLKLLQK